jgi:predicted metalloprotease with PDZ domain
MAVLTLATIRYQVEPVPSEGRILVTMTLQDPKPSETFFLPAWTPGHYKITDAFENLRDVVATDSTGRRVPLGHPEDRAWIAQSVPIGSLTIRYAVVGNEPGLGIFAVHVDSRTAFVNGSAAFLYAQGRKSEDIELTIKTPSTWQIACALDRLENGTYRAESYDELADSPVQMGDMQKRSMVVGGRAFETVWVLPDEPIACDISVESERFRRIFEAACTMMKTVPFRRYLMILHLNPTGFNGGLEHQASSVLAIANRPSLDVDHLVAHEIFHAWNGKVIRPINLGPFDYQRPARTANLWFVEGVTDYFASLILFRSGLISEDQLLDEFTSQVTQLQISRARREATLEVASREIWSSPTDGYKDLSVYNKGYVAALLFEALIRNKSQGKLSLLDLVQNLHAQCAPPRPGYGEDQLRQALNDLLGEDQSGAYSAIVRSTNELPYGMLRPFGLRVVLAGNFYEDGNGNRFQANDFRIEKDPKSTLTARKLCEAYFRRS